MIQKGQLHGAGKGDILTQKRIIAQMLGWVAEGIPLCGIGARFNNFLQQNPIY
jgi:hypothetical protein